MHLRFAFCAALVLTGCATTSKALVSSSLAGAFDAQPDSAPTLCTADAQDLQVTAFDQEMHRRLVAGLVDGTIAVERWQGCVEAFAQIASAPQRASLGHAIGRGFSALVLRSGLNDESAVQQRLRALQSFYVSHAIGTHEADDGVFAELREALAGQRLGPVTRSLCEQLLAVVDMERGVFRGRTVDVALLDELCAAKDMDTLRRMATHLPSTGVREAARRRVIRLLIAASPISLVRARAAEVEERVLKTGVNAIQLDEQHALSASLDPGPFRGVLVEQDLARQTAKLVGYTGNPPADSVVPAVNLRGVLSVQVEGLASPVTVCGTDEEPDVSPCIAAQDIGIDNALAHVDSGIFRFADHLPMEAALALAAKKDGVTLSMLVGGKSLLALHWPMSYARPDDLVMASAVAGGNAPDLSVSVAHHDDRRYFFTIDDGQRRYVAVAEASDLPAFHVMSAGRKGANGSSGFDGTSGFAGGDCGFGTDGGSGSDGRDGGPGGDGGNVTVHVTCDAMPCDDDVAALRKVILSVAGAGGEGGRGGAGGAGGAAGGDRPASTHRDIDGLEVVDQPGCLGGPGGRPGIDGRDGNRGAAGRAGQVRFVP